MPASDPCGRDYACELVAGFSAAYDKASGRLYERHLHSQCRSSTYRHDAMNRLTRYERGTLGEPQGAGAAPAVTAPLALAGAFRELQYNLDKLGNWNNPLYTQADGSAFGEPRTHNALNQVTQVAGATLTYDGNGNLTSDGTLRYKYDPLNRLKEVWKIDAAGDKHVATYWYDALGRRIKREVKELARDAQDRPVGGTDLNVPAGETHFLYARERCIEERDGADLARPTRQYVWGQYVDELVQQREYDQGSEGGGGGHAHFYPLSDLTWRTVALTDACRCVVEAYDIDAYGRTLVHGGPGQDGVWFSDDDRRADAAGRPFAPRCRFLFTGREFDAESGLYYFRARSYSPTLGRFIQRDPLGYDAGDANLYAYCGGEPLVNMDPDGEIPLAAWILAGVIVLGMGSVAHAPDTTSTDESRTAFERRNQMDNFRFAAAIATLPIGMGAYGAGGAIAESLSYNLLAQRVIASTAAGVAHTFATDMLTGDVRAYGQNPGGVALRYGMASVMWGLLGGVPSRSIGYSAGRRAVSRWQEYQLNREYLFRGTTPGWPGNPSLQRLRITPTSSDPGVGTVFAIEAETTSGTPGVLLGVRRGRLASRLESGNVLRDYELEVPIGVPPRVFERIAEIRVTARQAQKALRKMGVYTPERIGKAHGELSNFLRNDLQKLTRKQRKQFIRLIRQ